MSIKVYNKMENKLICPECKSNNTKKRGFRYTENRSKIQRYFCNDCRHSFIQNDGFFRMRNSPQKITLCLDLFYRGVSTRKVQEHLQAFYPHNADHSSILRWIIKYSKIISKFTDKLKIKVGSEIQVDEVEYHRRKSHKAKRGIDENFFIDSIDTDSRFMVASNYVKARGQKEIKDIMSKIKKRVENKPKMITTDGLTAYPDAIRRTFGLKSKNKYFGIEHNKVNASKGEGFNHPIERLHNTLRARTKTFRGFHGSIESANAIMKGLVIYYNFIRKHQAINKCPYELATDLKLNENNKWLELIQISKKQ